MVVVDGSLKIVTAAAKPKKPKRVPKDRRVVEIRWLPRSAAEWATFTAARKEAARLRNAMVRIHARFRRARWMWPGKAQWSRWARGRFPALSAQSVQQAIADFCDTIDATTEARKAQRAAGEEVTVRYPWRTHRYRDVPYTNQEAQIRHGVLTLPHGKRGGKLHITLPVDRDLPGRLMEATLVYGVVRLVCEVTARAKPANDAPVIGVDPGVNTILAATDGRTAVMVSGREAKAIVRHRNKTHAKLRSRIDRCKPGSRRRKRLTRAKYRSDDKSDRRLRDVLHKSTRAIADAFPGHKAVMGKPFNDAAQKMGRKQAQQVASASNAKLALQLGYKLLGVELVPEPYSSQTCPGCGCRQKCRRVYRCKQCGLVLPRDAVGGTNIRRIRVADTLIPTVMRFVRPLHKYPGPKAKAETPGRPGGTPAWEAAA